MSYSPAERITFDCRLADLGAGPQTLTLGPLNRRVTISLAAEPGSVPRDAEFTFTDPDPRPGINPYWLRVVQADMELAWSSPVFVDYVPIS